MENITISEYTDPVSQLITEYVTIDKGNGEYTFMPKSVYDEQQANQNNPVGGN